MRQVLVLTALVFLAACQQTVDTDLPDQTLPETETIVEETLTEDGLPTTADGTLVLREPDTCGLDKITQPVEGQPPEIIDTLGLTRTIRVIRPGDIVTQEYDPHRINFYIDGMGLIDRVSCG